MPHTSTITRPGTPEQAESSQAGADPAQPRAQEQLTVDPHKTSPNPQQNRDGPHDFFHGSPKSNPNITPTGAAHQFSYRPTLDAGHWSPPSSEASGLLSDSSDDVDSHMPPHMLDRNLDLNSDSASSSPIVRSPVVLSPIVRESRADESSSDLSILDLSSSDESSSNESDAAAGTQSEPATTTLVAADFTIEEIDPMDSEYDGLEILRPTEIESNHSRSSSLHEINEILLKDLRNLNDASGSEAVRELRPDELHLDESRPDESSSDESSSDKSDTASGTQSQTATKTSVAADSTIEKIDPMDRDYDDLKVLRPTEIESNSSRFSLSSRDIDEAMIKKFRVESSDDEDGSDILDRLIRELSLCTQEIMEMDSCSDDEALDAENVGSSARRSQRKLQGPSLAPDDPLPLNDGLGDSDGKSQLRYINKKTSRKGKQTESGYGDHHGNQGASRASPSKHMVENFLANRAVQTVLAHLDLSVLPDQIRQVMQLASWGSIQFSTEINRSAADRIKSFIEDQTGSSWNWWPIEPPKRTLQEGLQKFANWFKGNSATVLPVSTPSFQQPQGQNESPPAPASTSDAQQPSVTDTTTQNSAESLGKDALRILFGVPIGRKMHHIVPVPASQGSGTKVFPSLQREYKMSRGRWKALFSFWQFSHCNFVKFEAFARKRAVACGNDLPTANNTDYDYTPKPPQASMPPIHPHIFEVAFNSCGDGKCSKLLPFHDCYEFDETSYVTRIPKKKTPFGFEAGQPIVWGLEARHSISALHVVLYHLLILIPPFVVWAWWQKNHPNDIQSASVPMTVIIASISMFWSATGIIKQFRGES
ncbi:hypothetical protein FDECE_6686 [Fusarium decemcellulare]|nr:hypothetical protein FDECE_6686 [Fusarium decemcellulare]